MRSGFLQRASKKSPVLRSLCGATLKPSTADRGVASWMESLRATRANPSRSPVDDLDGAILDTYGPTFAASLARSARASFSLRTSMPTLFTDTSKFSEISKDSATQLRLDCTRREALAHRISGTAFSSLDWMSPRCARGAWTRDNGQVGKERPTLEGQATSWATPQVMDSFPFNRTQEQIAAKRANKKNNSPGCRNLVDEAQMWRTPDTNAGGASDRLKAGETHRENGNAITLRLEDQVQMWQTPAVDPFRSRSGDRKDDAGLDRQAKLWPTANAAKGGPESKESKARRKAPGGVDLQQAAQEWATPLSRDHKTGGFGAQLSTQISLFSPSGETTTPGGGNSSSGTPDSPLRLNPNFVEHLMGWPIGSTGYGSEGMEWSLWRRRMRFALYTLVCGAGE
jgi:hypothetical protein